MKILVIGGTRFFGIHMVEELLKTGHDVTIATRGLSADGFSRRVQRIVFDRTDADSVRNALSGRHFDVIIDKLAYCSNDIRSVMDVADCNQYIHMSTTAVYGPKHLNVIGKDDYTKRLLFYVEHIMKSIPMYIDNPDCQIGFIRSDEAGRFLTFLAGKPFRGAVNGCSEGTVSIREMLDYVEQKTGKKAILSADGDTAPYNGEPEYSINTDLAASLGFRFSRLHDWIFELLDYYIDILHQDA